MNICIAGNCSSRLKDDSQLMSTFKCHWLQEYLSGFKSRRKRLIHQKIFIRALVEAEASSSGQWCLGMVKVNEDDADGSIRRVHVCTANDILCRDLRIMSVDRSRPNLPVPHQRVLSSNSERRDLPIVLFYALWTRVIREIRKMKAPGKTVLLGNLLAEAYQRDWLKIPCINSLVIRHRTNFAKVHRN